MLTMREWGRQCQSSGIEKNSQSEETVFLKKKNVLDEPTTIHMADTAVICESDLK